MKRLVILGALVVGLALPAPAAAFHHVVLPADVCGRPANAGGNNPTARAAIREHNDAQTLPLPPVGTPGADNANDAPADENCAKP